MSAAAMNERRGLLQAFGAFGLFWGAWAALLPAVRQAAGVTDGQLGLALAAVALAALPAMPLAGRLVDRVGRHLVAFSLLGFAVVTPLPALAHGPVTLVLALVGLGATTGFLDVVVNASTAAWERAESRRLMSGCHGLFSLGVLVGSVLTGLARDAGAGPAEVLPVVALALLVVAGLQPTYRSVPAVELAASRRRLPPVLLAVGVLVASAFLVEDALQSWSALQLERGLGAPPWVSGLGPGLFAGAMAAGRLLSQALGPAHRGSDRLLLGAGGVGVAVGALMLALAPHPLLGLAGLVVAGAGTSVLAPTLFSVAGERSEPGRQGADLARVTTLGYTGFVLGPPLVGVVSGLTSLPVALGLLAVVGLAIAGGGPAVLRRPAVPVGVG